MLNITDEWPYESEEIIVISESANISRHRKSAAGARLSTRKGDVREIIYGILSDAIVGDLSKNKVDASLSIVYQVTTRMTRADLQSLMKRNYNLAIDKSLIS